MIFADKLSTIRQSRKLTQQLLAKKAGIGISQMRRYEKGNSSPTLEVIKNIALTLGTSTDELIFDDNDIAQGKILDRKLRNSLKMFPHFHPTIEMWLKQC